MFSYICKKFLFEHVRPKCNGSMWQLKLPSCKTETLCQIGTLYSCICMCMYLQQGNTCTGYMYTHLWSLEERHHKLSGQSKALFWEQLNRVYSVEWTLTKINIVRIWHFQNWQVLVSNGVSSAEQTFDFIYNTIFTSHYTFKGGSNYCFNTWYPLFQWR